MEREKFPVLPEFLLLGAEEQMTYCISVLKEKAVLKWKQIQHARVKGKSVNSEETLNFGTGRWCFKNKLKKKKNPQPTNFISG